MRMRDHACALHGALKRGLAAIRRPLAAAVLFCTCGTALCQVAEKVDYRYYPVDAGDGDFMRALDRATPIREDGRPFHGHAESKIQWTFHWRLAADGMCRITRTDVSVDALITLPRLVKAPSTDMRSRFDAFVDALQTHELGHQEIAREAAHEIIRRLETLPPHRDCRELESIANGQAQAIVNLSRAKQVSYDLATGHGATQGAVVPGMNVPGMAAR